MEKRPAAGPSSGKGGRRAAIRPAEEKHPAPETMLQTLNDLTAAGTRLQGSVRKELEPSLNRIGEILNSLVRQVTGAKRAGDDTGLALKQCEALSYQGRPVPDVMKELEDRFIEAQAPMVKGLQTLLDRYRGQALDTFEANRELAGAVNRLARDYGIRLIYENRPVTLRCVNATRTKAGSFQVRLAAAGAPIIHTSTVFPPLKAARRAVGPTPSR